MLIVTERSVAVQMVRFFYWQNAGRLRALSG
jgi:hypothetical protein